MTGISSTDAPALAQRVEWTRGFRCATDKAVLSALVRWYAWRPDGTSIRPSTTELATRSHIPLRSVERALQRLVSGGWLQVTTRQHRGRTTYRLVLDRLATDDPDRIHLAPDRGEVLSARVADKTPLVRHSGGQETSGGQEIGPDFDKVADEKLAPSCYVPRSSGEERTGYTHTPAAPFRHPNHTYCGAWFCVPTFLDEQFQQQSGATADDLQAWYRDLNAACLAASTPIGDALKWLRAQFAAWVHARPGAPRPPQQLSFGPLAREVPRRAPRYAHLAPPPDPLTAAFARVVHEGCRHTPACGDHRTCAWKLVQQERDNEQEARP